ncbi:unnamed protein product [Ilex paraguariensis]|uniref:Uncharacterized protein n=1 Tax=Ilex paraguariensis TaxID=185542 RepID=A0ABC8URG7_9AQUA
MNLHSLDDSSNERQKPAAKKWESHCSIILPFSTLPFLHSPLRPPFKPNLQVAASHIVRNIHKSGVFFTDKCLSLLHEFVFQSPLLKKVFSLPSDFHNISQISRRKYTNLNNLSNHNFAAILPGDSVAGVVVANGILNFLNIYNTLLIVRLVLTWFPNTPPAIVSPLSTLCDPYLNIFRGIIPPLGGTLDLSPILAFLVLNAFTSTAAALPAELPSTEVSQKILSLTPVSHLTTSQKKWMTRLAGNRSKSSSSDN